MKLVHPAETHCPPFRSVAQAVDKGILDAWARVEPADEEMDEEAVDEGEDEPVENERKRRLLMRMMKPKRTRGCC